MDKWVEIFRSNNLLEAQMISQLMEQHGLKSFLIDDNMTNLVGMGGIGLFCRIMIEGKEYDRAKRLLMKIKGPKLIFSSEIPKKCPNCGVDTEPGFDICWNCEAEL